MTELTVLDLLRSGSALRPADVLTVAEVLAHHLAQEHAQGRYHGDIGPHTVVLELAGPFPEAPAVATNSWGTWDASSPSVQDARLIGPRPAERPPDWPTAPEGPTADGPGDLFALGQVLRRLDASARSSSDDTGLPAFVRQLIEADPTRRPTAQDLLTAFDDGMIRPASTEPSATPFRGAPPTPPPEPAPPADADSSSRAATPTAAAPRGAWPLTLAAVGVFALVLGGGLWWSSGSAPAPLTQAVDDGAGRAVLVDDGDPDADSADESAVEPTSGGEESAGTDWATAPPGDTADDAATSDRGEGAGPEASQSRPGVTSPSDTPRSVIPGAVAPADVPVAEGATEFDQAWCRAHGTFVARARTDSFAAVICQDGGAFNYHGLNLTDGLSIRTPAVETEGGWTGLGEGGVTYEVSPEWVTVRDGQGIVLAREEVYAFLNDGSVGSFRPGDLMLRQPNSYPACDGSALVVIDTFYGSPDLRSALSKSLATNPGSAYLSTTTSCDSLERPSHEVSGTGEIYLTYYVVPADPTTACEAIDVLGTHGFWLRDGVAPGERVECQ